MPRVILLTALAVLAAAPRAARAAEPAKVLTHGNFVRHECRGLADVSGFSPAPNVNLSRYGGWSDLRTKATGFFHSAKLEDRWWIIDPEGCVFLSIGINSVAPVSLDKTPPANPENLRWGEEVFQRMRSHGFNTAGCWSAPNIATGVSRPMPYCLRWSFMAAYRQHRRAIYPATVSYSVVYPFDPEFAGFCDRRAEALAAMKEDPWLLGHFSDNELPFQEKGIVGRYLDHPADDPNHAAAAAFMAERKRDKPTGRDDRDFLRLVVDTYYKTIAAAIRKHDPNHMFLGSRFHGRVLSSPVVFEAAGKHADVISVNYYHRWTPENGRIEEWACLAGKPILMTEWYAMAVESGLPTDGPGAGFAVRSQDDRARFYEHFALTLLENPACVGWHWFRYRDGTNNAGLVNADDKPYEVLWKAAAEVNTQAYPLAIFLNDK